MSLDTTRADLLGAYGRQPSPSPTVDRLAAEGARFEEVMSPAPLTLPAHTSMLSGLYPDRHGARDNAGFQVGPEVQTLAERLSAAGWQTGGFVGAAVLDGAYGLDQGFSTYVDGFNLQQATTAPEIPRWPADVVVDRALDWWSRRDPSRPAFVFVHLYDVHLPHAQRPSRDPARPDPYADALAFADAEVARLLEGTTPANGRRRLVIVTADHGEGRGDHGEATHGWFVYRSTLRVPWVVQMDGVAPGQTVPGVASLVDIAPTVLDLVGLPVPAEVDGRSWAETLRGGGPLPTVPVFGETWNPRLTFGYSDLHVAQDDQHRWIDAPRPELYAWRHDPSESRNLWADADSGGRALGEQLAARRQRFPEVPVASGASDVAALQALGYLATPGPVGVEAGTLPDPKDDPQLPQRSEMVVASARIVPPSEGIPRLEAFLARQPTASNVRMALARAQELTGHPDLAVATLRPLVEASPRDAALASRVAGLELAQGRSAEAMARLRPFAERGVAWSEVYAVLAEADRRGGDCAAAGRWVEQGLAKDADATSLRLLRGACALDQGQGAEALDDLQFVWVRDPENRDIAFLYGTALARSGRVDEALTMFRTQVERTPDRAVAQAALGAALYARGDKVGAVPHLELALLEPAVGAQTPLLLADALLSGGDAGDRVGALLEQASAADPGNPDVYAVRGSWHLARGESDAALADMERRARLLGQQKP